MKKWLALCVAVILAVSCVPRVFAKPTELDFFEIMTDASPEGFMRATGQLLLVLSRDFTEKTPLGRDRTTAEIVRLFEPSLSRYILSCTVFVSVNDSEYEEMIEGFSLPKEQPEPGDVLYVILKDGSAEKEQAFLSELENNEKVIAFMRLYGPISASAHLLPGDVDDDGAVTAADARRTLRAAVSLEPIEKGGKAFICADMDEDGSITASDARTILRIAVGLK
jgi:hypothetical protein